MNRREFLLGSLGKVGKKALGDGDNTVLSVMRLQKEVMENRAAIDNSSNASFMRDQALLEIERSGAYITYYGTIIDEIARGEQK